MSDALTLAQRVRQLAVSRASRRLVDHVNTGIQWLKGT
jgi:hypothetical protein